jgi:hypothetical protein
MPDNEYGRLFLTVDGKDTLMPYVQRLTYTEAVGELDGMTATLKVPTEDSKDVIKLLEPGKTFIIETFEGTTKGVKREGDVIAVTHERVGRTWVIVLIGVNYLHRLRAEHVTEVWEKGHSDIVKAIAGRAKPSLKAKVEGVDTTADFTFQQGETDAMFLMRLAREHNYICRVVGKELHFARPDSSYGTAVEIDYAKEVYSLRLTANLKDYINEVNVFWGDHEDDGLKFTKLSYKTKPKETNSGGKLGCDLGKSAFSVSKVLTIGGYDSPLYKNQTEAKAKAKAEMDAAAMSFVEGVVKCVGLSKAACGAPLKIKNAGWPFDGKFIISKVFHEYIGGKLKTEVTFRANSLPKEA